MPYAVKSEGCVTLAFCIMLLRKAHCCVWESRVQQTYHITGLGASTKLLCTCAQSNLSCEKLIKLQILFAINPGLMQKNPA